MACLSVVFFFFKQKTAYEMRISDWSSDVCSSDLDEDAARGDEANGPADLVAETLRARRQPERGDRGPAGSGKAVEGRPAGGWTHHGGSPHVAIPLSRGRRPGLAWRRSTCRTCLPRCDAPPHRPAARPCG